MDSDSRSKLEATVKCLLRERSLSMRQLATMTGINVGTISKMVTGKQRVNPEYLQRIAHGLSVSPDILFQAAGFDVGSERKAEVRKNSPDDFMNEILRFLGHEGHTFSQADIERELQKYEGYAKTDEGCAIIAEKYHEKRNQISGGGDGKFVSELDSMFEEFTLSELTEQERAIVGSGLLYFILATDAIPDYVFPIGYVDDVIAMQMTRKRLEQLQRPC